MKVIDKFTVTDLPLKGGIIRSFVLVTWLQNPSSFNVTLVQRLLCPKGV